MQGWLDIRRSGNCVADESHDHRGAGKRSPCKSSSTYANGTTRSGAGAAGVGELAFPGGAKLSVDVST